jgi:hypothetical protein
MKAAAALAAAGIAAAFAPSFGPHPEPRLIIASPAEGHLSPCGCAKPMLGGILRRASALRFERSGGPAFLIEPGPFVADAGRQSEIKAETLAESAGGGQAILGLTAREAALGPALVASMARLSGGAVVCSHLRPGNPLGVAPWKSAGAWLFGSFDPDTQAFAELTDEPLGEGEAMAALMAEAQRQARKPALMLRAGEREARAFARRWPQLRLIVFQVGSSPGEVALREGETELASAGSQGRRLLALMPDGQRRPIELGPQFADDDDAAGLYRRYLARVSGEKLLEAMPRRGSPDFAGSNACMSCHPDAAEVWKGTAHADALATLEQTGNDRDPDCVSCHVVGLDTVPGFQDRKTTPELSDVGCESCHGPGADHVEAPHKAPMARIGSTSCAPCHNAEHSPLFNFDVYWERIKH